MTAAEILQRLERTARRTEFDPYSEALLAAEADREAIVPDLISALDRVSADPARVIADPEYSQHLFALLLLAQFRETRALDCFIRFCSLPDEQTLELTGDLITNKGDCLLASVCGGNPAPLLQLLHNADVNEYVRWQAVDALAVQMVWGERKREDFVEDLRGLFRTLPRPGCGMLWAALACIISDAHVPELVSEVRHAFVEGLVDEDIIDLECFEEDMVQGEVHLARFREDHRPVGAMEECSGWICFGDAEDDSDIWEDVEDEEDVEGWPELKLDGTSYPDTYVRPVPYIAPPKLGRNEPCPCGSGIKYKKCCGK